MMKKRGSLLARGALRRVQKPRADDRRKISQIHFATGDLLAMDLIGDVQFGLGVANAAVQVMDFDDIAVSDKSVARHLEIGGHFVNSDGYFDSEEVFSVTASLRFSDAREEDFRSMQCTYLSDA
jgi:hypothetical protein